MAPRTLYDKLWDAHVVRADADGTSLIYIDRHLVHEVTSPQAYEGLRLAGRQPWRAASIVATADHNTPTQHWDEGIRDPISRLQVETRDANIRATGAKAYFPFRDRRQGIVHVIGPELGLTQPGMTICCGDSHTSTHGAFGAIAFGIGTSQVRDVLASQTLGVSPLKVRRIDVQGQLAPGVFAKDVILTIIGRLGVKGGTGYAYEYGGDAIDRMTMDERMTICNMSIEGGARAGYVNPDKTTVEYLRGRRYAPSGDAFERATAWWLSMASDTGAQYDDRVVLNAAEIEPTVTWGINPGQSVGVGSRLPKPSDVSADERPSIEEAIEFMGWSAGQPIAGTRIDVAFVGSCTNGRLSDLREAARIVRGRRVASHVRALVVPGSQAVRLAAEREGLDEIFRQAGFDWRGAGCSMCLAMNPDRLEGREICASSSNRNFKGRQGSPTGRTLLMSPAMVAAAAVAGEIVDVRGLETTQ